MQLDRVLDRSERTLMIDLKSDTFNEMCQANYAKFKSDPTRVNTQNQERALQTRVRKTKQFGYVQTWLRIPELKKGIEPVSTDPPMHADRKIEMNRHLGELLQHTEFMWNKAGERHINDSFK